ncbi:Signal peptidase complex catalytic subunit SEC11C [Picochlorum sp. SENEW3]|nr:Signal peptidase complex catalytic subunit SEC11C [Picochlorum sp. SENEW3]
MFSEIRNQPKRQMVQQAISLAMIITSALMIWKGLIVITKSESPIVVVLSGSMEPGFARGDILFLNQPRGAVHTGDIVVYNTNHRDIPIVHRIIKVHHHSLDNTTDADILTKGDNNYGDDVSLYPRGMSWLNKTHVMGRVVGFLPYVGRATIIMNDYPIVKYALIAILGVVVMTSKE